MRPSEAAGVTEGVTEDVSITQDCVRSESISHHHRRQRGIRKRYRRSFINLSYQQLAFRVENFMKRDAKINYYTGLQKFAILRALFKFVYQSEKVPKESVHQRTHKFTPLNELFLTLMKLRRGFHNEMLSDMFCISKASVRRIFVTWINLLYTKLGSLYIWPHKDVLLQHAPSQFLQKYPGVIVIGSIACVEFIIKEPSSLIHQSQLSSSPYKGATSLKSLIMIDPNGAIIFISALFTGSISDKRIVEESGFSYVLRRKLELGELQHEDIILADKGFNVTDVEAVGTKLNIPTFRITGLQSAAEDFEYIKTIAQGRVHVERAIWRLRAFTILSECIPVALLDNINKIYTVCALLTNFRYPVQNKSNNR